VIGAVQFKNTSGLLPSDDWPEYRKELHGSRLLPGLFGTIRTKLHSSADDLRQLFFRGEEFKEVDQIPFDVPAWDDLLIGICQHVAGLLYSPD
jgi:hypothetical protein